MTRFAFHVTNGTEKNNEELEKVNDNSSENTGSDSLKATGSETPNVQVFLCFKVISFPFGFKERHSGWLRGLASGQTMCLSQRPGAEMHLKARGEHMGSGSEL